MSVTSKYKLKVEETIRSDNLKKIFAQQNRLVVVGIQHVNKYTPRPVIYRISKQRMWHEKETPMENGKMN